LLNVTLNVLVIGHVDINRELVCLPSTGPLSFCLFTIDYFTDHLYSPKW